MCLLACRLHLTAVFMQADSVDNSHACMHDDLGPGSDLQRSLEILRQAEATLAAAVVDKVAAAQVRKGGADLVRGEAADEGGGAVRQRWLGRVGRHAEQGLDELDRRGHRGGGPLLRGLQQPRPGLRALADHPLQQGIYIALNDS